MKYINWLMFGLQLTVLAIICFVVFGCANIATVEENKRESDYRKSIKWQERSELPDNIEWEKYESIECEYDDGVEIKLTNIFKSSEWEKIELSEDELPKYQIIELADGRKKVFFKGDGKDPRKNNKKVAGFTVPEADPNDCIGEVCRGSAVPYMSNYFATGNTEGVEHDNFREWYEKEVRKIKLQKWLTQNQKYGADYYKCHSVTRVKAKDASKPINVTKEWADQWPSLREEKQ